MAHCCTPDYIQFWSKFLDIYKDLYQNTQYKNYFKLKTVVDYRPLVEYCKERYKFVNSNFVTRKIHNFRCGFMRERRLILKGHQQKDQNYKANLWYFKKLLFLIENSAEREILSQNIKEKPVLVKVKASATHNKNCVNWNSKVSLKDIEDDDYCDDGPHEKLDELLESYEREMEEADSEFMSEIPPSTSKKQHPPDGIAQQSDAVTDIKLKPFKIQTQGGTGKRKLSSKSQKESNPKHTKNKQPPDGKVQQSDAIMDIQLEPFKIQTQVETGKRKLSSESQVDSNPKHTYQREMEEAESEFMSEIPPSTSKKQQTPDGTVQQSDAIMDIKLEPFKIQTQVETGKRILSSKSQKESNPKQTKPELFEVDFSEMMTQLPSSSFNSSIDSFPVASAIIENSPLSAASKSSGGSITKKIRTKSRVIKVVRPDFSNFVAPLKFHNASREIDVDGIKIPLNKIKPRFQLACEEDEDIDVVNTIQPGLHGRFLIKATSKPMYVDSLTTNTLHTPKPVETDPLDISTPILKPTISDQTLVGSTSRKKSTYNVSVHSPNFHRRPLPFLNVDRSRQILGSFTKTSSNMDPLHLMKPISYIKPLSATETNLSLHTKADTALADKTNSSQIIELLDDEEDLIAEAEQKEKSQPDKLLLLEIDDIEQRAIALDLMKEIIGFAKARKLTEISRIVP